VAEALNGAVAGSVRQSQQAMPVMGHSPVIEAWGGGSETNCRRVSSC